MIEKLKYNFQKYLFPNNDSLRYINNKYHIDSKIKTDLECSKEPKRYEILNYILKSLNKETRYLEIGVRNPDDNFNKINTKTKYSVDPGYEFEANVDFLMTSDIFFQKLRQGNILSKEIKFDVIFIDGLHLAEQVERDILNALDFIEDNGFVVLHDCNPPTEFHASENYEYRLSPAEGYWNGTTWKAFVKFRSNKEIFSCCIDSDWGVGVISKGVEIGISNTVKNEFYEYKTFAKNRKESLNLISFDEFKTLIG